MSLNSLTPNQLRQAANLKEKIQKLERELAALLGGFSTTRSTAKAPKKKGKMSAAGRAAVAAAQRARWAKIKATSGKKN